MEYEKCLTTLQQISDSFCDDEEDYHDQTKSKLEPFVSNHRATRNDDVCQQPNTYVAGERYHNPHVLSETGIVNDKTTDDNISLTTEILRSIVSNAFEEQKKLADVNITETIKCAFSDGIKKGSELGQYLDQTPLGLQQPIELKADHLLSPSWTVNTMRSSPVINVNQAQSVSKLPVFDINSGLDGNKTLHTTRSTGKRYKRETTLKFSEGSVETCEKFRSQFNIHRMILGWDDNRTAVELFHEPRR